MRFLVIMVANKAMQAEMITIILCINLIFLHYLQFKTFN